ncbi:MAG TPA: thiamine phosphate synthase [Blastocatellia bacterium]|nr:thiamine phosphate synthase [Blastocatellia bacterium]
MLLRKNVEPSLANLISFIEKAIRAGVDLIQIRERDLCARDQLAIASKTRGTAEEFGARVLVNDRADIALAAGAGVHLTTRSMGPAVVRRAFGSRLLVGASTHSLAEAELAEREGADFVVFGPVFDTESKRVYGPPVGTRALSDAASRLSIPVLALGGIKLSNFQQAIDAGAAGLAAITLFTDADDLLATVRAIKKTGG